MHLSALIFKNVHAHIKCDVEGLCSLHKFWICVIFFHTCSIFISQEHALRHLLWGMPEFTVGISFAHFVKQNGESLKLELANPASLYKSSAKHPCFHLGDMWAARARPVTHFLFKRPFDASNHSGYYMHGERGLKVFHWTLYWSCFIFRLKAESNCPFSPGQTLPVFHRERNTDTRQVIWYMLIIHFTVITSAERPVWFDTAASVSLQILDQSMVICGSHVIWEVVWFVRWDFHDTGRYSAWNLI